MDFNINDVSGGVVSKFTFGMLACLITSYSVSMAANNNEWTTGSVVIISIVGILLVAWLIWFFAMYLGGKKIVQMHGKSYVVVEGVNWILFAIWVASEYVWKANPCWVIAAWSLFAFSTLFYFIDCHRHNYKA